MGGGGEGLGFFRMREGLKLWWSHSSSEISSKTRLMARVSGIETLEIGLGFRVSTLRRGEIWQRIRKTNFLLAIEGVERQRRQRERERESGRRASESAPRWEFSASAVQGRASSCRMAGAAGRKWKRAFGLVGFTYWNDLHIPLQPKTRNWASGLTLLGPMGLLPIKKEYPPTQNGNGLLITPASFLSSLL